MNVWRLPIRDTMVLVSLCWADTKPMSHQVHMSLLDMYLTTALELKTVAVAHGCFIMYEDRYTILTVSMMVKCLKTLMDRAR